MKTPTRLQVQLLEQLASKPDNESGYNRITVEGIDVDEVDAALAEILANGWANGLPVEQPFGPRLVAYVLSSLTPRGLAALTQQPSR